MKEREKWGNGELGKWEWTRVSECKRGVAGWDGEEGESEEEAPATSDARRIRYEHDEVKVEGVALVSCSNRQC